MVSKYKVMVTPTAQKQIRELAPDALPQIISCLESLEANSHPTGVEKLNQNPNFWRFKAGSYRIIYTIIAQQRIIVVALVSLRHEIHREVANLNRQRLLEIVVSNPEPIVATGTRH